MRKCITSFCILHVYRGGVWNVYTIQEMPYAYVVRISGLVV